MASTIKIKSSCTLKHQPNLGEDVADVDLDAGTELQVLKAWETSWLAKDDEGRLFNVKKHLAEEK